MGMPYMFCVKFVLWLGIVFFVNKLLKALLNLSENSLKTE